MQAMFSRFLKDRSGTTAVEYGMIIVCLSLVIIGGISQTGNSVEDMFANPARALQNTLGD
ncbi:MAG: Flp family type IVb pilin [Mesorhizobium sp.]|nr:Flp family type IVb pilin [Mesorhizobium sp.]MCO5162270.1 Flp family type IVb pilin [Mesorhizobium sp.]